MMPQQQKSLLVIFLLVTAMALAYGTPRPKYQSTGILKKITLADHTGEWTGQDVKQDLNLGQKQYAFIGDIKTKKYTNPQGMVIYFTVLDADNFHDPRVCFSAAGYTTLDLPDTELETANAKFQAPTIFFGKKDEDILLVYWLCIDKQRVKWAGQKLKEFWFSLAGKKKTGFTVRLDIPVTKENIKPTLAYAQDLIRNLSHSLPKKEAEYIFGK